MRNHHHMGKHQVAQTQSLSTGRHWVFVFRCCLCRHDAFGRLEATHLTQTVRMPVGVISGIAGHQQNSGAKQNQKQLPSDQVGKGKYRKTTKGSSLISPQDVGEPHPHSAGCGFHFNLFTAHVILKHRHQVHVLVLTTLGGDGRSPNKETQEEH